MKPALVAGLLGLALASCGSSAPPQLAGSFTAELRPADNGSAEPRIGRARITLDGHRATVVLTDPVAGERTYQGTRSLLGPSLNATRGSGGPCDGVVLAAEAIALTAYSSPDFRGQGQLTVPVCEGGRVSSDSAKSWTIILR